MVVIHYTAMDSCDKARDWLCREEAQVSAHYIISERGEISALVPEKMRAWHAGAGAWGAVQDVNSHSIGIELANTGFQPFADPQISALEGLLRDILSRWNIPRERVIGHSDCSIGRKIDPGRRFDWARLARAGLAVASTVNAPSGPVDDNGFYADLARIGYRAEATPEAVLSAFRLRHRNGYQGPLDARDCTIARDLATRFPVDETIGAA